MKVFYFGCTDNHRLGYYMEASPKAYDLEARRAVNDFTHANPWGLNIDGGLCPRGAGNGQAVLNYKDGWTVISFWDNSVDKRSGSNSNFIAEGQHTFEDMVKLARHHFPTIWDRFQFQVFEVRP